MDSLAFVFGARIRQIDDWLPNWHTLMRDHPGATCTIVIVSTSERHVDDMVQRMHAVHLDCKIELSTHRDVRRDYALAPLSAQQHHKDSTGHWPDYVIVSDDDTVYLDMRQYRRMLSRYDPSIPYFIGSASDTAQRRHVEGAFAYGGASMIITSALLGSMHGNYEQCLEDLPKEEFGGGDLYLALCTSRAIGLQPQRTAHRARDMTEFFNFQSGLHQCDYTGNGDGFYQSGERFLTLHHFLSKIFSKPFPAFIDHQISLRCTVLAAQRIGGQNLYKRFVFEQGRQLWVPGHSFTRYSRPIAQEDFALMEVTMKEVYFLEPTRPGITEGIDASVEENTKQTFYLSATSARSPTSTVLGYTASDNSTMTILVHHEAVDI
ncbi:glycosyltransferase family 31 protein [Mixia osmundae IAM 14324]|uniref:Fringe-like glycosyltransferase domain-containing protein n=1 Tax=Mixia osmundae (strain CBS 9802 / IAM 14324 / JCM 22182 / KY 12970) TaxID=764103 RepID=G7DUZ5_MIXOS|nr:glycosyltransferase family 31 protein [Mixia osmundae IAM 14324]KEI37262.1 glycosyltransferase family 31 protein [Mixia osmundae IAM 14324]GAA94405.1 hypothetical protein E5Q_01057 [Mixia osmundae IAM 14324]